VVRLLPQVKVSVLVVFVVSQCVEPQMAVRALVRLLLSVDSHVDAEIRSV
jgi:hypothetical protein